jgi:hypothetical protein
MLASFLGGVSSGGGREKFRFLSDSDTENISELGSFPKGNGFAKNERGMLLKLTSVKDDFGDLEPRVSREFDQAQFGSIETHFYLR